MINHIVKSFLVLFMLTNSNIFASSGKWIAKELTIREQKGPSRNPKYIEFKQGKFRVVITQMYRIELPPIHHLFIDFGSKIDDNIKICEIVAQVDNNKKVKLKGYCKDSKFYLEDYSESSNLLVSQMKQSHELKIFHIEEYTISLKNFSKIVKHFDS